MEPSVEVTILVDLSTIHSCRLGRALALEHFASWADRVGRPWEKRKAKETDR